MVSTETVAAAMGAGKYALALEETCIRFGIVTTLEKAHFLARVAHESDEFATAREYDSGRAYEGREDFGNVQMGDGIRYNGRGLIQVTGRANYAEYSRWKYGDDRVLRAPEMLEELPDGVDAAAWHWTVARPIIPALARADNLVAVTRAVNGGTNGVADCAEKLDRAEKLFGIA